MLLVFGAHTQTHTRTDTHTHCKSQISEGRQEQGEQAENKSNRRERARERESDMIYNEIINLEKRPALYSINTVCQTDTHSATTHTHARIHAQTRRYNIRLCYIFLFIDLFRFYSFIHGLQIHPITNPTKYLVRNHCTT